MRSFLLLIILALYGCSGRETGTTTAKDAGQPAPIDVQSLKSLRDVFSTLDQQLPMETKNAIASCATPFDTIKFHGNLGMWMRNNLGFWGDAPFKAKFLDEGIGHPDEMSGLTLRLYWAYLIGQGYPKYGLMPN